jgi:hypothetical protein
MASLTPINITASLTVNDSHTETVCTINAAAGLTVTLPAAYGSGKKFTFLIGTTVTSNNVIIQVANSSDTMAGICTMAQDAADTVVMFETAAASDTITMNGSTKGGLKGDQIILQDVSANLWSVAMVASGTGTEATPFSAAV